MSIRIALTKGRLEKASVELFEKIGYDVSELRDKGRKLLFKMPPEDIEVVLAKSGDVITYVEHGVCDCGITGKDTIMEQGSSFYEPLDLGFGRCKFIVATKKGYDLYSGYGYKKIASKYPEVAKEHFRRKNMDVEVIKIDGSVELAPILGLADAIVDIMETGTTLKENGLVVVEEVCDLSARLIVNTASMKMKKPEIDRLVAAMAAGLKEE